MSSGKCVEEMISLAGTGRNSVASSLCIAKPLPSGRTWNEPPPVPSLAKQEPQRSKDVPCGFGPLPVAWGVIEKRRGSNRYIPEVPMARFFAHGVSWLCTRKTPLCQ